MKKAVLAVDDSRTILNMLELYLKDQYEIYCTVSGDQAFQILQKHSIDIILLDIIMPVMNGMMVLKKIRETKEYQDIPVLFLTGDARRAKVIESHQMGSQGYILKPVAKEELQRRIEETIVKQEKLCQKRKEEEKKAEEKKLLEAQKEEGKVSKPVEEAKLEDIYKDLQVRQSEVEQKQGEMSLLDAYEDIEDILENFVKEEDNAE